MNLNSEAIMKNDVEIAINNVSVVFKDNQGNDVKALDNVDFDIDVYKRQQGVFCFLIGLLPLKFAVTAHKFCHFLNFFKRKRGR